MKKNEGIDTEPKPRLTRDLGLLSIVMLGVGAMIGAGVFVLTGMAAGEAGPGLVLAFVANGLIALIVGACYAELGAMMPRAGERTCGRSRLWGRSPDSSRAGLAGSLRRWHVRFTHWDSGRLQQRC